MEHSKKNHQPASLIWWRREDFVVLLAPSRFAAVRCASYNQPRVTPQPSYRPTSASNVPLQLDCYSWQKVHRCVGSGE